MRPLAFVLVALLSFVGLGEASAQDALPDVVETQDGGLLRGVIVERAPGQYVVIRTASGELRRVEETNIRFAGPAAAAVPDPAATPEPVPSAAPSGDVPPPPVTLQPAPRAPSRPGAVRLRVTSDPERLTLMLRTEAYASSGSYTAHAVAYDPLCTAPCETELEQGVHFFAVREPDGDVRVVRGSVDLRGSADLQIGIQSRRGGRIGLAMTGLALTVIGVGVMITSRDTYDPASGDYDDGVNRTRLALGSGFVGVGLSMIPMVMFIRNRGRIDVRPAQY